MRLASVVHIAPTNGSRLASLSSGTVFDWASSAIQPVISYLNHQQTSRSCLEASRRIIRSHASSPYLRCSKWTRPIPRPQAQTSACGGTIVRTAISSLSIRRASGSPVWSRQTRPSTTKIALPSNSRTPGVREVVMKRITRKDIKVDRAACPWLIKRVRRSAGRIPVR